MKNNLSNKLKRYNLQSKRGFSLVEVILASSVYVLIITTLVGAYLYGLESTALSGNRAHAVMLAEEGLEATRNIRDVNYANITDGTYGIATSGNQWTLSGSSDTKGIFTRTVTITSVDAERKDISSQVSWQQNPQRTGDVTLTSRLNNWRSISGPSTCANQADQLSVDSTGATLAGGNRSLQNVFVENTNTTCDITFDKITITWTNASRNIRKVTIGNIPVWIGSEVTGTELEIDDTALANSDGQTNTGYQFDGNMNNNTFTITFIMSDGTSKVESGISP
jgi:Tfp pilus assembly protein PilV